jgi:UDP-glucuronate 4-epimerase
VKRTAVLVTGAAGFIGGHLCAELLDAGQGVCGIDDLDPYYSPRPKLATVRRLLSHPWFRWTRGDVRRTSALDAALRGVDTVVHLAARPGVRQSLVEPDTYYAINVGGTRAVLEAALRHGIRRIVFASSSSVYGAGVVAPFREDAVLGPALSPYAETKREGEQLARAFAAAGAGRVAILRLFSVYGPRQRPDLALHRFARCLARREAIPRFGDGSSTRDYTHVLDVVAGVRAALAWTKGDSPACEVFNLGSGRPVRLDSLIAKLGAAMGVAPLVEPRPAHPADLPDTWADIGKARATLGYAPSVTLDAGIADFVTWFGETNGRQSHSAA